MAICTHVNCTYSIFFHKFYIVCLDQALPNDFLLNHSGHCWPRKKLLSKNLINTHNIDIYFIFGRPNNDIVRARKKQKLFVKIGDIVTFSVLPNKKISSKNLHKIIAVRNDLRWKDVLKQ